MNRVSTPTMATVMLLGVAAAIPPFAAADDTAPATTVEGIRIEAARSERDPIGRPLPLASHWTGGMLPPATDGFTPRHQMELIAKGHHILPWFQQPGRYADNPPVGRILEDEKFRDYFEAPIRQAAAWKLPLVFVSTQWESALSRPPYLDLPTARNPNVVAINGTIRPEVSPFGLVALWREVGRTWTDHGQMRAIQAWYPEPPLVIFLSNNEHPKLAWPQVETCQTYLERHGRGQSDDVKRRVIADGWIERYRALQGGLREGLTNPTWRAHARFVGYNAFGLEHVGRWAGWKTYSQYTPGRLDPNPLIWDGGSPSYYTDNWNPRTDFTAWSPQIEFMNNVAVQQEARRLNPEFWLELSIWDGYAKGEKDDKRAYYRYLGQTYSPERYAGWLQFGMWLLRPRVVREFRGWTEPWLGDVASEAAEPYFLALVGAVDRVHTDPVLRAWWRKGELVPNRAHPHPHQCNIPPELATADRWFLLDADCNPSDYPYESFWKIPVFALALTRGQTPTREWLVYAHAPLQDRKDVTLTLPGLGPITVDVPVCGVFYQISETERTPARVSWSGTEREKS